MLRTSVKSTRVNLSTTHTLHAIMLGAFPPWRITSMNAVAPLPCPTFFSVVVHIKPTPAALFEVGSSP